jgi:hypothetical protein
MWEPIRWRWAGMGWRRRSQGRELRNGRSLLEQRCCREGVRSGCVGVEAGWYNCGMATAEHFLDMYLDPLADVLTPEVAQRIVALKPSDDVVAHVSELGRKADEGALTPAEAEEYRALADAGTLVSLLKAKARRALARGAN